MAGWERPQDLERIDACLADRAVMRPAVAEVVLQAALQRRQARPIREAEVGQVSAVPTGEGVVDAACEIGEAVRARRGERIFFADMSPAIRTAASSCFAGIVCE